VGEDAFADLPGWSVDDPEEVSPLHPRLRVARFELELAEAEARAIAAEAWPRIEIGPQLSIEGGTRVGGLVDLRLPWPPTLEKRIRAAAARRDAAVYAYEDALHREREALVRARASVSAARERASQAGAVEHAERRSFEAANARFFVGGAEIGAWAQALGSALDAAALSARSRAEIAFAELDLLDARGVIDRMGRANGEMSAMRTEPRR
jgi:outer membrane protein TolC